MRPEVLSFFSSLLDSLIWPICAMLVFYSLRSKLRELIPLIRTIRYKGVEIGLKENVEDAANRADLIKESGNAIFLKPTPESIDPDPRMAVIKAWASVQSAIENLAMSNERKFEGRIPRSTRWQIEKLREVGVIDHELAGVLADMNGVRNMIAHGEEYFLPYETVKQFVEAANHVESIVEHKPSA